MNNFNPNAQPQAETTQTQVESQKTKKFGRVAAIGGIMLAGAAALTVAVPEGNAQSPAETSVTQIDNSPQNVLPGTELRLKPNPRREVVEKPAEPAQEQTTEVTTPAEQSEPAHDNDKQDKPKKHHEIDLSNDIIEASPEPAPPIVEVTDSPLPAPENPDPINQ
jgi:hypothetical protein